MLTGLKIRQAKPGRAIRLALLLRSVGCVDLPSEHCSTSMTRLIPHAYQSAVRSMVVKAVHTRETK